MNWLGIDIGGANLKLCDAAGNATSQIFPLWLKREELADVLRALIAKHSKAYPETPYDGIALTMTGELADCYASKAEGVEDITQAAVAATAPLPIKIATVDDRWLTPEQAIAEPMAVAAANWRLVARQAAGRMDAEDTPSALMLDVGSTTSDLIRIEPGRVTSQGRIDIERLLHQELVYTGVRRTPICALVSEFPYRGKTCSIAAEWFATVADVWLLLGEVAENETDKNTADGRPSTIPHAVGRLGRCLCADHESFTHEDALLAAEHVAKVQTELLAKAIASHPAERYFVSGEGEFLARRAIAQHLGKAFQPEQIVSLSNLVGSKASECGPAFAAAFLAAKEN